jgi:hypothetical protein
MKRSRLLTVVVSAIGIVVAGYGAAAAGDEWSIKADIAEACNCDVVCPCILGGSSTHEQCEGSRLVQIHQGHVGDVDLAGIPVVITFRMGEYAKYWVGDSATDEQLAAATRLMNAVFPPFEQWGVLSTEKVPVSVERSEDRVKYSAPSARVEIEVMKGGTGQPIRIENLGVPFLEGYTQYRAVVNAHESKEHNFSYSGTNGFTSTIDQSN